VSLPARRLHFRIIWTTALGSLLAMGAMTGIAIVALNAVTRNAAESSLRDRFVLDSTSIKDNPRGPKAALASPLDSVQDSTWVYDSSNTQLLGPEAGRRVQAVVDHLSYTTSRTSLTHHERMYLAGPVRIGGPTPGRGVLVVSQSLEPYEDTRTEVLVGLVALGLLVAAGATGLAAWTMARTLAPVESMASLADDWSQSDLDARFDDLGTENEITHLGHTLNHLLDRVAGALRSEQRLTAELAHELRTPLTGIRGEVELALMSQPDAGARQRLDRVISLVDQMSGTITTLLAIARGDSPEQQHSTTVDAVLAATLTGRDSAPPAVRRPEPNPGLRVEATTEIAVRALSPLVDNALRYANEQVTLSVLAGHRSVDITVSDDGPGVDGHDGDPDNLFASGTKAPGSPGAGLGLALARRVAHSLGGDVSLTSPGKPTSFTLTLPKA
jgi:two-component system OmpR family sensor kinase